MLLLNSISEQNSGKTDLQFQASDWPKLLEVLYTVLVDNYLIFLMIH
jgi:hypothetical protein